MSDINQTLGEFIREVRTRQGVSLRELARRADISANFLKDIEYDRRSPSEPILLVLAKALNVPATRLRELNVLVAIRAFRKLVEGDRDLNILFVRLMNDFQDGRTKTEVIKEKLSSV